jgi:hypothetical protein
VCEFTTPSELAPPVVEAQQARVRNPSKGQELLKYIHKVRLATSRVSGVGWSVYDEHYRLRKVRFPHCNVYVCDVFLTLAIF